MERDWFIVNHWEDKFCRDAYRDPCVHAELQHLRAFALLSPGTTPQVCPVDSLVNTSNKVPNGDEVSVQTLGPCSWRYVLSMDDLARLRLKARSDVHGRSQLLLTSIITAKSRLWLSPSASHQHSANLAHPIVLRNQTRKIVLRYATPEHYYYQYTFLDSLI